ncbi:MAG: hemolysin family protein [Gammaproteobacteria bacterium]|nr:hemolysin family protein [Gammaproteobacteria bacterium]
MALGADFSLLLEPEMVFRLVLLVALFFASAFFSGSETALFSLSRMHLRRLRREHSPQAETLHALLDQPRRLIISILCGNEIVNVAAAANLTGILVRLYGVEQAALISTVLMVPLLLLFGEATPKTIAVSDPIGVSTRMVARPMNFWVNLISPVSAAIRVVADRVTTAIVGQEKALGHLLQVDEFRTLVDEGVVRGELSATERALIYNLLQAGSAEIVEIMVPRSRVACIDGERPLREVIEAFMGYRHQRVPVYRGDRDNVVGFLYAEDIMQLALEDAALDKLGLEDIMRPPVMVPVTKKIDEMFDYFQRNDVRAVAVLNEFGGIDGLLTMNDVLTCIFGRTHDASFESAVDYDETTGAYSVPGDMTLIDFAKLTSTGVEDSRMTTIAGVILRHVDRLPVVGDSVTLGDLTLEVLAMESNRISRVRAFHDAARARAPAAEAPPPDEEAPQ